MQSADQSECGRKESTDLVKLRQAIDVLTEGNQLGSINVEGFPNPKIYFLFHLINVLILLLS